MLDLNTLFVTGTRCAPESARGQVWTKTVGTCRHGYCFVRSGTSGHEFSSHRSRCLPKFRNTHVCFVGSACGQPESARDAFRSKYPIFWRTPASVATESMARHAGALRTVAIFACPDRFAPYSTDSALRSASGPGVESASLGLERTGTVRTCRDDYYSERLATSGDGYSGHESRCPPKYWIHVSNHVPRALGLTA